jgi:hypothetical protein
LINSSVTLEAGMLGLESSVKWRGTTRFEHRRLRCRESTPDAYRGRAATGSHRGHWDRPARPKLDVRPAAPGPWRTAGRCEPGTTMATTAGGVARAAPGLSPCGLPRPGRGLLEERARLPGQPARPGGSARPRRVVRRRPALRTGNRGRGRGRTQTVPGRPDRRQSTVEPRCGSGLAVPACLVGWSVSGYQAKGGEAS